MRRRPEGITWLASYPKSGNTWLRIMLASYRNGGIPLSPSALPADMEYADVSHEHYEAISSIPIDSLTIADVFAIRGAAMLHMMSMTPVRPLFVKTHTARCNVEHVEAFPPAFSQQSVYIVRDPRDVCVSFAKWMNQSIDDTIEVMSRTATLRGVAYESLGSYMGTWSEHVSSWVGREDTLVLKYEDMLADTLGCFLKVLEHVDLPVHRGRAEMTVKTTTFDMLQQLEAMHGFIEKPANVEKFFRKGRAGGWVDDLSPAQADRIVNDHGEVMERMGYTCERSVNAA